MYTIGELSKFTKTTIKTLRYYDEIDLLTPTFVDPKTGFRYYDYIKFSELEKINYLKDLGFSLKKIKELIDYPHLIEMNLIEKQNDLMKERELIDLKIEQLKTIKKLNQYLPEKDYYCSGTKITYYKEREFVFIKKRININEIDSLVEELMSLIFTYQLKVKGNLIGYFSDKSKIGKQEVQLMFELDSVEGVSNELIFRIPEGSYLSMNFIGLYSYLPYAYEKLARDLSEKDELMFFEEYTDGLVPDNLNQKTYKVKPKKEKDPRKFVTTIFVKYN